ncbi:hypothetical protein [Kordiimonas marina]|uniref:hypothetical protein n=1 Tax=Kordiimonas marina TaxID=2872312 RepID=UPI001FF665FE|nr:hypothetical protein [Kordiimonas marina]MCJ9429591.1 hypothetical protein [Kordiimonas marina]
MTVRRLLALAAMVIAVGSSSVQAENACKVSDVLPKLQALALNRIPAEERSFGTMKSLRLWDQAEVAAQKYDEAIKTKYGAHPDTSIANMLLDWNALERFHLMRGFYEGKRSLADVEAYLAKSQDDWRRMVDVLDYVDLPDEALTGIAQVLVTKVVPSMRGFNMGGAIAAQGPKFLRLVEDTPAYKAEPIFAKIGEVGLLAQRGDLSTATRVLRKMIEEARQKAPSLPESIHYDLSYNAMAIGDGQALKMLANIRSEPEPPDPNLEGEDLGPARYDMADDWKNRTSFSASELTAMQWDRRRLIGLMLTFEQLQVGTMKARKALATKLLPVPEQSENIGRLYAYIGDEPGFFDLIAKEPPEEQAKAILAYITFLRGRGLSPSENAWKQLIGQIGALQYQTYEPKQITKDGGVRYQMGPNAFEGDLVDAADLVLAMCHK